ncbi:hypothetical protein ID866_9387, partial [Astraeus odoratus]
MYRIPGIDLNVARPFYRKPETPVTFPSTAADGNSEAATTVTVSPFNQLFYDPTPPPSLISPQRSAGISPESTETLVRLLVHNHITWHIFFNYTGLHNHVPHHLLALWAMGACAPVLEASYTHHCEYQRPAFESPGHITQSNFYKHLGDERYYSAYLAFFTSELLAKGLGECLEEYVFSPTSNFAHPDNGDEEQPWVLSRFLSGYVHAFIHVGYGAEFGILGVSAEGLAMAAAHQSSPGMLNREWFQDVIVQPGNKGGSRSALTILSLLACDPRFSDVKEIDILSVFATAFKEYGSIIREYVEMWKFDVTSDAGIADAVEELSWMNSTICGVGGHVSSERFNADFLLAHILTSSLFLPSILSQTSKLSSRRALLLGYFT